MSTLSRAAQARAAPAALRPPPAAPRAAAPVPVPARWSCACGGRCPRCRDDAALEHEADRFAAQGAARFAGLPPPPAGGGPLPAAWRAPLGQALGHDLGAVRLHVGAAAAARAARLGARAFTQGHDIVFGARRGPGAGGEGRRLLLHELAHVAQQAAGRARGPQRDAETAPEPALSVSGDRERSSPPEGVALGDGTLSWRLRYIGRAGSVSVAGGAVSIVTPSDVQMDVGFAPAATAGCPTVTFTQIVRPTTGGLPDTARLLFIRDSAGFAADVGADETEPYYGLGPAAAGGAGLQADMSAQVGGSAPGRAAQATFADAPVHATRLIPPGQTTVREFEVAPTCVETGATFGSIRWGYQKTSGGVITLTGGQAADVRTGSASPAVESARQAYYAGHFQHSLSGFARGSAQLIRAHRTTLLGIAAQPMLRRVVLVGANDNSGGPEARAALSLERATAARDFLVTQGVDAGLLAVQGHGVAAREPNPPGRAVAANRRVDIHVERGFEGRAAGRPGSAAEAFRLRRQNPRATLDEFVDLLFQLQHLARIPEAQCHQLTHLQDGLRRWRRLDPSVPDVDAVYGPAVRALRGRCESSIPRTRPSFELAPLERRSFMPELLDSVDEAGL